MAWKIEIKLPAGLELDRIADLIHEAKPDSKSDHAAFEQAKQIEAAKSTAVFLLLENPTGSTIKKPITVTLSGHANVRHDPKPWYERDSVTVKIEQAPYV